MNIKTLFEEFELTNIDIYSTEYRKFEIEQSLQSISMLLKHIYYPSSTSILVMSLFKLFQNLEVKNGVKPAIYSAYTQSIIVRFLKLLEKNNIIEIVSLKHDGKSDLSCYYNAIGNREELRMVKMYDINFYKLRDITADDIDMIRVILAFLKIDNEIMIKEKDGKLDLKTNKETICKNCANGEVLRNLKDTISILKDCLYLYLDDRRYKKRVRKK